MLKLTGGLFRGRELQTPPNSLTTRPTQAKLRQAWFNSLQFKIPHANVLDLFAGSGALGFEALSRGAHHVTFVEKSRTALTCIQKNATTLQVQNQIHILEASISITPLAILEKDAPFDLVLIDPPYHLGWEIQLLTQWPWTQLLSETASVCLEWGAHQSQRLELPNQISSLVKTREKHYGDSILTTYEKNKI